MVLGLMMSPPCNSVMPQPSRRALRQRIDGICDAGGRAGPRRDERLRKKRCQNGNDGPVVTGHGVQTICRRANDRSQLSVRKPPAGLCRRAFIEHDDGNPIGGLRRGASNQTLSMLTPSCPARLSEV
jgi:hypothetical protein